MKRGVSVITCTNRSDFFSNMLANYRRQRYLRKELIIIVNNDRLDLRELRRMAAAIPNVSVYRVPGRLSLGQCLNCGLTRAKHALIAKFDHDDYYSPYYLREQTKAIANKRCSVVGKHACLVYLAASRRLVVRSPGEKDRFQRFVQGGTLLFRREVLKDVRFPDKSLGEDVRFLRDCARKGHAVYATTPFNYVYIRRKDKRTHTWKVEDHYYLRGSLPVAVTGNYVRYAIRRA